MKLKEILQQHQKFKHPWALKRHFGDSYLLHHNPIYLNVRKMARLLGFKFQSERFFDYEVMALTQLPKILAKKTIPYSNTVRPLLEIERRAPGVFNWSDVPPLKANYVLHESAHGIGNTIRRATHKKSRSKNKLTQDREATLGILFEESFANACESVASLYATDPVHQEFFQKNAYVIEYQEAVADLKAVIQLLGPEPMFKLTLLSFLHSNFLSDPKSLSDFKRMLKVALKGSPPLKSELSPAQIQRLRKTFQGKFELDPAFTVETNRFCLRLMGIRSPLVDVLSFDFMSYFENAPEYLHCLHLMTKAVLQS